MGEGYRFINFSKRHPLPSAKQSKMLSEILVGRQEVWTLLIVAEFHPGGH